MLIYSKIKHLLVLKNNYKNRELAANINKISKIETKMKTKNLSRSTLMCTSSRSKTSSPLNSRPSPNSLEREWDFQQPHAELHFVNILIDQFTPKVSAITVTTKMEDQACALSVHTRKKRPIADNGASPVTKNGKILGQ